jgi:histidinol-phosphate aminotransferase
MDKVAERCVILLDEAYQEYLSTSERFDSIQLVKRHPNLILARTFSKAYGLAGLRVGYAVASPELTAALNRVRPTFNVGVMAQLAAVAALKDEQFVERTRQLNNEGKALLETFLRKSAIEYVPSRGNFILAKFDDAAGVNRRLLQRGVIVRPVANYGLSERLRISVGTEDQNCRLMNALVEALS